jgi:hypothetical protein
VAVHGAPVSFSATTMAAASDAADIEYRAYSGEAQLAQIAALVEGELSEPYVVYTYRYFLHQWFVRAPPASPPADAR